MVTDDVTPNCVLSGWVEAFEVINEHGPNYRLLRYEGEPISGEANNWLAFEHRCDRGARGVITCAPALSEGHMPYRVSTENGPNYTVRPSILCPDCGTHGFVTQGRWSS